MRRPVGECVACMEEKELTCFACGHSLCAECETRWELQLSKRKQHPVCPTCRRCILLHPDDAPADASGILLQTSAHKHVGLSVVCRRGSVFVSSCHPGDAAERLSPGMQVLTVNGRQCTSAAHCIQMLTDAQQIGVDSVCVVVEGKRPTRAAAALGWFERCVRSATTYRGTAE